MIRFTRLFDISSNLDKDRLAAVLQIYQKAFPYYPQYAEKISKLIKNKSQKDYEVMLLIAEGRKSRILGFSLTFLFQDLKLAYLDYIASDPARSARGIGAAIYETTREILTNKSIHGLLMDVPPDEKDKLKETKRLQINIRRMKFYEQYGARPIVNTSYESIDTKANAGHKTFLVYDSLNHKAILRRPELKKAISKILLIKADMTAEHPKLKEILNSVKDDPIKLREPRYTDQDLTVIPNKKLLKMIDVIKVNEDHKIHHFREKGYVERPARIDSILQGLAGLNIEFHKPRRYSDAPIKAVHDKKFVSFIIKTGEKLATHKPVYPDVFPKRRLEKLPTDWTSQTGYFALDSFTPLTSNVYQAAKSAVNCALTGVDLLLSGSKLVYALCRPPGHHAEKRAFGGFCYFNNASIAAHALSKHGKVAFIDIDYHHGNGSQNIFYDRKDVYFISIHGHPNQAYPYFAGYSDETGEGEGKGYNRNYPLYPGVDNKQYIKVLNEAIKSIIRFKPRWLVVSLGLDIMKGDPTGTFLITANGMKAIGEHLATIGAPTLLVQEGGYSLTNLRNGVRNFLLGFSSTLF